MLALDLSLFAEASNAEDVYMFGKDTEYIMVRMVVNNINKDININVLKKGSKVSITTGKLSKFTGIFLEQCSKTRSKVLISMLNSDYVATIDSSSLQRSY